MVQLEMEVLQRLFNHNPSTQGELSFFMQEFDERIIKDENVLNKMEEESRKMCEETLPSVQTILSNDLAKLTAKVLTCEELFQRIPASNMDDRDELQAPQKNHAFKTIEFMDQEFDEMIKQQKDEIFTNFEAAVSKLHEEYDELAAQIERENCSHQT